MKKTAILVAFAACSLQAANANFNMEVTMPRSIRSIPTPSESDKARFFAKIKKPEDEDGCWIWTAGKIAGYGVFGLEGANVFSHRLSYFLHVSDPREMLVLHKCDNPPCCNPRHLFLGTHLDNAKDRNRKNRQARGSAVVPATRAKGEAHHKARLTEEEVREIRASKDAPANLGRKYSVTRQMIFRIQHNIAWRHLL